MNILGNIIWLLCGGFFTSLTWFFFGTLWCLTIFGIPIGIQCYKLGILAFCPFGKELVYDGGTGSFLLNIIWFLTTGMWLALESLFCGILLSLTIILIPFALQHFKFARLAIMPFGSRII